MEDRVKEEVNESLGDEILGYVSKASALLAGAALLYRGLGEEHASQLVHTLTKGTKTFLHDFERYDYNELNIDSLRDIYRNGISRFKRMHAESQRNIIDNIGLTDSQSLMRALAEGMKHELLSSSRTGEAFRTYSTTVKMKSFADMRNLLNPLGEATKANLQFAEDFIEEFSKAVRFDGEEFQNKDLKYRILIKGLHDYTENLPDAVKQAMNQAEDIVLKHAEKEYKVYKDIKNDYTHDSEHSFIAKQLLNIDNLEKKYGTVRHGEKTNDERLLNSQIATLGDLLASKDKINDDARLYHVFANGKQQPIDIVDLIEQRLAKMDQHEAERFKNLKVSHFLRKNGSDIYSFYDLQGYKDTLYSLASRTLPGKLLKISDFQQSQRADIVEFLGNGSIDMALAGIESDFKSNSFRVAKNYIKIFDKFYTRNKQGEFQHIEALDNYTLISGQNGSFYKEYRQLMGLAAERTIHNDNKFKQYIDCNRGVDANIIEKAINLITKANASHDLRKEITHIIAHAQDNLSDNEYLDAYNQLHTFINFTKRRVKALDQKDISALLSLDNIGDGAKQILNMLHQDDSHLINDFLSTYDTKPSLFKSLSARQLAKDYIRSLKNEEEKLVLDADVSGSYYGGKTKTLSISDRIRKVLSEEVFARQAAEAEEHGSLVDPFDLIHHMIEGTNLSTRRIEDMKRMAYYSLIRDATPSFYDKEGAPTFKRAKHDIDFLRNLMSTPSNAAIKGRHDAKTVLDRLLYDEYSSSNLYGRDATYDYHDAHFNKFMLIRKATSVFDIAKEANEGIKNGVSEGTIGTFFGQFFAGRNKPQFITKATLMPFFILNRLNPDIKGFGLELSNNSMKSTLGVVMNIALKRILPLAIGYTALDYVNDTVGAITGNMANRPSALALRGIANIDLGARKVADALGIRHFLNYQMDFAPMQYWGGKDGFYDYNQERDYYTNGVDPIRSGRYWIFGSANEFRGGKIQYFLPNFFRREISDYHDKSLYSSYWDKWSHSLLPTPTNPLSPLFYILDPYYLEREHKYDRPYLYSAPMFSAGSPWGEILNPTIGALIKPRVRMNEDRLYGGTDIFAIMYNMNQQIKQRALDSKRQNITVLAGTQIMPALYTDKNAPDISQQVFTLNDIYNAYRRDGKFFQFDIANRMAAYQSPTGIDIGKYGEILQNAYDRAGINDSGSGNNGILSRISHSLENIFGVGNSLSTFLDALSNQDKAYNRNTGNENGSGSNTNSSIPDGMSALEIAASVNQQIKNKAKLSQKGVVVGDKLSYIASFGFANSTVNNEDAMMSYITADTTKQWLNRASKSFETIAGIYGYGMHRFFGLSSIDAKHVADAGDMTNIGRRFWDASIGGIGGESMEIIRRFLPQYDRANEVSPLLNTMPDWLPQRFRFGDPYTMVPYGEARLPGRGYEALNKLHPDQYGAYGAFDRYKILADIAPYSPQFKIWSKIAQETVKNPILQRRMEDIKDRIDEQGSNHDFYPYRFIGKDVDHQHAFINKVLPGGKFTIYGDDKNTYSLAGVQFYKSDKQSKEELSQVMAPGSSVTLAIDSNQYDKYNNDHTINAAVFVDGDSVSEALLDADIVKRKKDDLNAADTYAFHQGIGVQEGMVLEALGHINLPLISARWLKIRSPMESYRDEQIYGTPYQTWSDIFHTILQPAWNNAISDNLSIVGSHLLFTGLSMLHDKPGIGKWKRKLISGAMSLTDRGAFIGGAIAYTVAPDVGHLFKMAQKVGALASVVGGLYSAPQNGLLSSMANYGYAGLLLGDLLDKGKLNIRREQGIIEKLVRSKESMRFRGVFTAAGVAAGVATNMLFGRAAESPYDIWVPDRAKKKWATEEYFDRLKYIKYMALFNKAANKAESKEGVDIRSILAKLDKQSQELYDMKNELFETMLKAQDTNTTDPRLNKKIKELTNKIIEYSNQRLVLKGGEYTRSALLYKQVADHTMYGLKSTAGWTDIIQALPQYERDYFKNLMNEKDPDKQDKILGQVSPMLRRALKMVWKRQVKTEESNTEYFKSHNLPGLFWAGWRPDIKLENIKAKTIKNEGQIFADFGIYESQYRNEDVVNAPVLSERGGSGSSLGTAVQLTSILSGLGLTGVNVSVAPQPSGITQAVINVARVIDFKVGEAVENAFS